MRSGIRRQAALGRSLAWAAAVGLVGLGVAGCGSSKILYGADGGGTGGGGAGGAGATGGGAGGGTNGGAGGRGTGGVAAGTGGRGAGGSTTPGTGGRGAGGSAPGDASVDRACVCPALFDPVCGTDGHTYGNSCEAQCVNVPVVHQGACVVACGKPPQGCCGLDSDCTAAQECAGPRCASGGQPNGICKTRPASSSGSCWTDADCATGGTCTGAIVCPCGSACLVPDKPGTCAL